MEEITTKLCKGCRENLPLTSFAVRRDRSKRTPELIKTISRCKDCMLKAHQNYRKQPSTVERQRWWSIQRKYGLSKENFLILKDKQGNCCKICRKEVSELYVDHDHTTLATRGLLCQYCNSGLGMFREDTNSLRQAIKYLERWK